MWDYKPKTKGKTSKIIPKTKQTKTKQKKNKTNTKRREAEKGKSGGNLMACFTVKKKINKNSSFSKSCYDFYKILKIRGYYRKNKNF